MKYRIASFVYVLLFAFASITFAGSPPPGNDGGFCHGKNHQTCRPDPQPSHGQDCQPHGNNPDGNDDHCGPDPKSSVAPVPSVPVNDPPKILHLTPPPTDTE